MSRPLCAFQPGLDYPTVQTSDVCRLMGLVCRTVEFLCNSIAFLCKTSQFLCKWKTFLCKSLFLGEWGYKNSVVTRIDESSPKWPQKKTVEGSRQPVNSCDWVRIPRSHFFLCINNLHWVPANEGPLCNIFMYKSCRRDDGTVSYSYTRKNGRISTY